MFCQKCGAEIPDNSTFCRQCGAPIAGKKVRKNTQSPFTNLLGSLKLFFTKGPEEAIMNAAGSKTLEWTILLGANVLLFMFAFAITSACLHFGFGFPILFGFLIALIANGVLFGVFFALMAIMRKKLPFAGMLNLYAFTTLPLTIAAVFSMIFAPVWHLLPMLFFGIALLAQFFLMYIALQKATENHTNFHIFIGLAAAALAVLFIVSHWLNVASVRATVASAAATVESIIEDYQDADSSEKREKISKKLEKAREKTTDIIEGFTMMMEKYTKNMD